MIFEYLKLNIAVKDEEFNVIYPERIRKLAKRHWTPIAVAKIAAQFLVDKPGTKVLDIGSGAGKFCMVGSAYTDGHFTGIEQREYYYQLSNRLKHNYRLDNVKFIHSNITQINFKEYDAFYFFNSFLENIDSTAMIDDTVKSDIQLYSLYSKYVREQLNELPIGTKLVTYWSDLKEIPFGFKIHSSSLEGLLKMWEKVY
jgi:predicted RNA methylase